jgi:hypothetical protein
MDVLALVLARVEAGSFREATPLAVQAMARFEALLSRPRQPIETAPSFDTSPRR